MPKDLLDQLIDRLAALAARVAYLESHEAGALTGTWTPAFTGTSTAGVFTYSTQAGFYYRIGELVFIQGLVGISAIGTPPVGNMRITGLPFTAKATTNLWSGVLLPGTSNFNSAASALSLQAAIQDGTNFINLNESFDNAANVAVPAANFTNASTALILSGFYRA